MDVRYTRQVNLPEIGEKGQKLLEQARVLVVGAGGLGSPILLYLVAMGIGYIGLIDNDVVSLSNLQRQILYSTEVVGKGKVTLAAERLGRLNPNVRITTYTARLTEDNVHDIVPHYDIVVDASDNYATRLLIDDVTQRYGLPYVYGSVEGFEGQVSVFNTEGAESYRDFIGRGTELRSEREVNVLGALAGVVGSLQAMEVVKLIVGCGETLVGQLLSINLLTNDFLIFKLPSRSRP